MVGGDNSAKPFGMSGYSSLHGTVHHLVNTPPFSNENKTKLYDKFTEHITKYLSEDIVSYLADKHSYVLLAEFSDVWNKHKVLTRWFYLLFSQLDKHVSGLGSDRRVYLLYACLCPLYL